MKIGGVEMSNELIDKKYIIKRYNVSEYQAKKLVTESKQKLVAIGRIYYKNRRVGKVPHYIVREILGLDNEKEIMIIRDDEQSFLNDK